MKRTVVALVVCALVSLTGVGPNRIASGKSSISSDENAIRAVVAEFESGWNRHDAKAMFTSFADSTDFVNWRGMWWTGHAEVEAQHAAIHARNMKESKLTVLETRVRFVRPDVAVARVRWRLEGGKDRAMKPSGTRTGLLMQVLTRENGTWLVQATQNTDIVQTPAAAPAR
jgi:uncharacterized protein (TIGR02246 family)